MKTYRHDFLVYAIFPVTFLLVAYWGIESWNADIPDGREISRNAFLVFVVCWSALTSYLFLKYALVSYTITQDGLMVKRLWSKKIRRWDELRSLTINRRFKYFVVRNYRHKVVVFASLDYFKDVREFVEIISQKIDEHAEK